VFTRVIGGGLAAVAVLLASACGGAGGFGSLAGNTVVAKVTITPAAGGTDAKPDAPIEVAVTGGTLGQVTVQGPGATITGDLDAGHLHWKSSRPMTPDTAYTVTVTARSADGKTTTTTSSFRTLKPAGTLSIADVTPDLKGETVGVGMPIMVRFNRTVTDKAAVEQVLTVTAEKPVEGAWRWIGGDLVIYRTRTYWPAHQKVTFDARLTGVAAGAGVYGDKDVTKTITIGAAQVSTVNLRAGQMTVTHDGSKVRTFQVSGGNGSTREYTTTDGVHLTMDKSNPVTMTSPGRKPGDSGYYQVTENYAVRISNSGEYVHESDPTAPSHGCIHAGASDARWFFDQAQRGDIVTVTGTDRKLQWDNGWGFWQLSFAQWKSGSTL
jgi:lipoprotein-anchoring transpeptidase ErfK/SrfK